MRLVGRHDYHLSRSHIIVVSAYGDAGFAVYDLQNRIERSSMFAQPLSLVESEDRDRTGSLFGDRPANYGAILITDDVRKVKHLGGKVTLALSHGKPPVLKLSTE
jgi:hypothetical protein